MSEKDYREPLINNVVIFKGVILGIIALIFISIILALTLSLFHSFSLHLFNNILIIFNATLITFVGFYIARHVENNGWLNGGLGGMLLMG
ncbi:MAG: TIGR04086 family membrane protein, partial [Halanaerobiales bacterium]